MRKDQSGCTLRQQFGCVRHARRFETFRRIDRPDTPFFGNADFDLIDLFNGSAARLVRHHVKSCAHGNVQAPRAVGMTAMSAMPRATVKCRLQSFASCQIRKAFPKTLMRARRPFRSKALTRGSRLLRTCRLASDVPGIKARRDKADCHFDVISARVLVQRAVCIASISV